MNIRNVKQVERKAKGHEVEQISAWSFKVTSGTSGSSYVVELNRNGDGGSAKCNCDWGTRGGTGLRERSACSHAQAVYRYVSAQEGRVISAWGSVEEAKRQHRQRLDIGDGVVLTVRKV